MHNQIDTSFFSYVSVMLNIETEKQSVISVHEFGIRSGSTHCPHVISRK